MSKINLNNYEAFLLDYLEGNLSAEDTADLLLFVSHHPELEIDLDDELPILEDSQLVVLPTEDKVKLQELTELETLLVLELDKEYYSISRFQELMTKYPEAYQSLRRSYASSVLVAEKIVFDRKSELKQPIVISMVWRYAAAAVFIGAFITLMPWDRFAKDNEKIGFETEVIDKALNDLSLKNHSNHKNFEHFDSTVPMFEKNTSDNNNDHLFAETNPAAKDSIKTPGPEKQIINEPKNNDIVEVPNETPNILDHSTNATKDSIVNPATIDDIESFANNSGSTEKLTVPEFLAEKVLKVEKNDNEPLVASILNQKTNIDVTFADVEDENKKLTTIKLGKFEYYKSSRK